MCVLVATSEHINLHDILAYGQRQYNTRSGVERSTLVETRCAEVRAKKTRARHKHAECRGFSACLLDAAATSSRVAQVKTNKSDKMMEVSRYEEDAHEQTVSDKFSLELEYAE